MNGKKVILAAHRGDRLKFPENTMPAFLSAIENGCDMIETDVRLTKDGELVIIHDRSAKRTAQTDVNIDELTLSEVKELDAGAIFGDCFKGTKVPTAREFITLAKSANILVNWELKVYPQDFGDDVAFKTADLLIDLIDEFDFAKNSMMNSFSARVLEYIFKKCGNKFSFHGQGIHNCRRSYDTAEIDETEIFNWCCLYPNEKGKKPTDYKENFDFCRKNNILPCICVEDNLEIYKKALDYGCRMFTSNNIYEADRILKALGVR